MTQADLAYAADSWTRHLSCLETGKAMPSREMIARLAEYSRFRFGARMGFFSLLALRLLFSMACGTGCGEIRDQSECAAHKPYPAFAVDRHWNIVFSNSALPQLQRGD